MDSSCLVSVSEVRIVCDSLERRLYRRFRAAIRGMPGVSVHDCPAGTLVLAPACDVVVVDLSKLSVEYLRAARERQPEAILCCVGVRCDRRALRVIDAGADLVLYSAQSIALTTATLRAVIIRVCKARSLRHLVIGDLVCDRHAHSIHCGTSSIVLSPCEWHLFDYLLSSNGRRATTDELQRVVFSARVSEQSNAVAVYVGYLRRKLRPSNQTRIVTVRGFGYELAVAESI